MATVQGFRLAARSCCCRPTPQHYIPRPYGIERSFTTTSTRSRKTASGKEAEALAKLQGSDNSAASEILALRAELEAMGSKGTDRAFDRLKAMTPPTLPERIGRPKQTFMNMGDPDPWEYDDTLEDDDDDINALGHGELEQHRETRHYARLAAWEMPLLSKLAKPFQPPTADMPLRFRYTTYMGEQHPAEKKVVVEFSPADMPNLTDLQREKLKKLAGVRYNPQTDVVKMNCEMFETQAQNKRYLGDLVDNLLAEARDPTDTFEDVPLDTRHHHFKEKLRFPKEWMLTASRKTELEEYRRQAALQDQQREISGRLIDGMIQIEQGLNKPKDLSEEPIPEMAMAGKRVAIRR